METPDSPSSSLKHELRTPLNHIIGYAEMLIEEGEDSDGNSSALLEALPDVRRIHSAGRRLLGVINDLFDESIPESERLDESRLHHEVRTPLNQIIGYVELLKEESSDDGHAFLEDLGKIHTAAQRLLELVLANFDAERFRGIDAEQVHEEPAITLRPPNQIGSILVADDDANNRDMLARRLRRLGHSVSVASHGREVIEEVRSGSFDLLLLDIVMPEMDGYGVLEHLRNNPPPSSLPVIVLSASDDSERVARCIEMGAEDYLPKPFDPVLLQARIDASLEKKRFRDREAKYLQTIKRERNRADDLLRVILPGTIAAELKMRGTVKPRRVDPVAVLFTDIVGFTSYCEPRDPETVHRDLQELVETMEQVAMAHGMKKIKTIGDAFLGASGLVTLTENPTLDAIHCGLAMIEAAQELLTPWQLRVGVHTGPVVAGMVGRQKYQYDIWGDTVNTAARMESQATPGSVCVSADTFALVEQACTAKSMGQREIKGKGVIELFEINGLQPL